MPVRPSKHLLLRRDVAHLGALAELALDLRSAWNHAAHDVWRQLHPELWNATHNPWVVLQTVSRDRLQSMLADPAFREQVKQLVKQQRKVDRAPGWFQRHHGTSG